MKKISKYLACIYIPIHILILTLFTFQNFLIFKISDPSDIGIEDIKRYTIKNKLNRKLTLYVKERNAKKDVVFFHGLGPTKKFMKEIVNNKYKNENVIFAMNRGIEKDQIIINRKLFDADLQAILDDYLLNRYKKRNNIINIDGHSFGTFLALRFASFCRQKKIKFEMNLFDPFISTSLIIWENFKLLSLLLVYECDSQKCFLKNKDSIQVYLSEFDNILPASEIKRLREFLKKNNIKFKIVDGVNHMSILLHPERH